MDNGQVLERHRNETFSPLNQYVLGVQKQIAASAAAVYVLHRGTVVNEWYSGTHSFSPGSRLVGADSRFNVASVRKTYLGFAVSLALYEGRIGCLDDPVSDGLVWLNETYSNEDGTDTNLFVSARELASWGQLHLSKGVWNGGQLVPRPVWEQASEMISPEGLGDYLPRNGFFWFLQDCPRALTELGHELPAGSYQSLGSTGCACLVIPEKEAVAVRMYNQTGPNPCGYSYLDDIRTFGNTVYGCLSVTDLEGDGAP